MAKKQPVKQADNQKAIIAAIIVFAVLLVLVVGYSVIRYGTGILQRSVATVSIGNQKITAMDFRIVYADTRGSFLYQYGSLLEMYGVDLSTIDTQTCLFDTSMTWKQYFLNQTTSSVLNTCTLLDLAEKDGVTLSETSAIKVANYIQSIKDAAGEEGISVKKYLTEVYGRGTTLKDVESSVTKTYLASDYYNLVYGGFKAAVTDEQIKEYYEEHKDSYDYAELYSFPIKYRADDTDTTLPTSVEARNTAEEIREKVTAANFDSVVKEYADDDFETAYYDSFSLADDTPEREWIISEAQPGEKQVLTDEDNHELHVVIYIRRYLPEEPTVNVRHILLKTTELQTIRSEATMTERAQIEAANAAAELANAQAKEKAEALLAELKNAGEEAFIAAARQNSADTGSNAEGGLYEDVKKGDMVEAFNDWIFDPSRQPGDMDIVESEYGYHVMYFVSKGDYEYAVSIKKILTDERYQEFIDLKAEEADYKINEYGISII